VVSSACRRANCRRPSRSTPSTFPPSSRSSPCRWVKAGSTLSPSLALKINRHSYVFKHPSRTRLCAVAVLSRGVLNRFIAPSTPCFQPELDRVRRPPHALGRSPSALRAERSQHVLHQVTATGSAPDPIRRRRTPAADRRHHRTQPLVTTSLPPRAAADAQRQVGIVQQHQQVSDRHVEVPSTPRPQRR